MGEHEKMGLAGERPWGEVLERYPDGSAKLKIANKLFREYSAADRRAWAGEHFGEHGPLPEVHSYKQGDELLCRKDERGLWCPIADECEGRA